jgi:hypothetical protein
MSTNSKKAVQEIKKLMQQFGFIADEQPVLASFKLEDETILQTSALKVGEKITKINEVFEQVALENGVYRLKENFEIEVKDGKLVAVKEIFLDAKLADGTQIKVEGDSLVEGAKVVVVTEQGEVPAPDGVHELEDGSKVQTIDGIIAMIQAADAEDESGVEGEGMSEDAGDPIEVEMMDMLKDFVKKMSDKMASMEQKMSEVENQFKSFKSEPAAKKIADGKTEFNKINSDANDDMIAGIMRLRKNNK